MSAKGHTTGMAGEYCVMEKLFRLNHEAALTIGNAKTVDILTKSPSGNVYQVFVKTIRSSGKWVVGTTDYSTERNLVFVFVLYRRFSDLTSIPDIWIMPADIVEQMKQPWLNGSKAVYCSNPGQRTKLEPYKNAWHYLV